MKRLLLFLILLLGHAARSKRPPVRRRTACGTLPKRLPRRMRHTGAAAFRPRQYDRQKHTAAATQLLPLQYIPSKHTVAVPAAAATR